MDPFDRYLEPEPVQTDNRPRPEDGDEATQQTTEPRTDLAPEVDE